MKVHVLSLGAGVQSTTLALMAAHGEIEAPDCAIFADTGWEPRAVYDHLARLREALPFPVHVVSAGNIREDILTAGSVRAGRFAAVPWYVVAADGSRHMGKRECTMHYKLDPVRRKVRELLGAEPRKPVRHKAEVWVGISTDEAARMKPSRVGYVVNRWPLIERGMSRSDCLAWLNRRGWMAPKSSCIGCPYRSNALWRDLQMNNPEEWADAVAVDEAIRTTARMPGATQFMFRRFQPLAEADLRTDEDRGQANLFNQECEGMCGV